MSAEQLLTEPAPIRDAERPAVAAKVTAVARGEPVSSPDWRTLGSYLVVLIVVAVCSLLGWVSHIYKLTDANIVMIFLAGVALVAARCGRGPAIAAAILSVLVFDYFFVYPSFSFIVSDPQYFLTFGVMLGIGLLISALTSKLQSQLRGAERRERRTAQLFQMTRGLSELSGIEPLLRVAGEQLEKICNGQVAIFVQGSDDALHLQFATKAELAESSCIQSARQALLDCRTMIQKPGTASESPTIFVPMKGLDQVVGVLGIRSSDRLRFPDNEEIRTLEICAGLIALSLERDRSLAEAHQAQLQKQQAQSEVQSEQLRNSLLNSVSHDLRTPLSTIAVTASSLLEGGDASDWTTKREVLQTVIDESHRLSRQVDNLLEITRISSGVISAHAEWEAIEEFVEAAAKRLKRELAGHTIEIEIDTDFPPLWVAGELMERVFLNLLDNAARYTPPGSTIEIRGRNCGEHVEITIADDGPGLPVGAESKVFERYFRGTRVDDGQRGIGLGLAICQSIIRAHGGVIRAANRPQGGAEFAITLPCEQPDLPCTSSTTVSKEQP
jgi:two-component system sensor histidine kinase KdpD